MDAAKNADKAAVRALLAKHADVNAPAADGATALHWAAYWDDLETAQSSCCVRRRCECGEPLRRHAAVAGLHQRQAAMIELLLKAKADPNLALPGGETALMTAARTGKVDAVKMSARAWSATVECEGDGAARPR